MAKRPRDHKAAYARRIERGLAKGLTKAQARGHPRANEVKSPATRKLISPSDPLHQALRQMKSGVPLTTAARVMRVSPERLRRALATHTDAKREGGRWVIADKRQFQLPLYSQGKVVRVIVGEDGSRQIGRYMAAVGDFMTSNDAGRLAPFAGQGVRDTRRRFHPFETDPNKLYELDSAGELSFPEIYRIVA